MKIEKFLKELRLLFNNNIYILLPMPSFCSCCGWRWSRFFVPSKSKNKKNKSGAKRQRKKVLSQARTILLQKNKIIMIYICFYKIIVPKYHSDPGMLSVATHLLTYTHIVDKWIKCKLTITLFSHFSFTTHFFIIIIKYIWGRQNSFFLISSFTNALLRWMNNENDAVAVCECVCVWKCSCWHKIASTAMRRNKDHFRWAIDLAHWPLFLI